MRYGFLKKPHQDSQLVKTVHIHTKVKNEQLASPKRRRWFLRRPTRNGDESNARWVKANIVRVTPPWQIITAWDFQPITKGFQIHQNCKASLDRIFSLIWHAADEKQRKINEWGMQLYAGGFKFRLMKSGTRLSMHCWGCAVDFDASRNSFGDTTPNFATIPPVLNAFNAEGWVWGGNWSKPDGMHWQAAAVK